MTATLCWHTVRPSLAERPRGALLLIHGWLGSSREWEGVARELPTGYHLVAVDLPGHGETPEWKATPPTFLTICQALAADTRDAFGSAHTAVRPIVVGYSLGGRIALQLVQTYPDLFRGLILIAAHPGLATEELRTARCAADEERAVEFETLSLATFLPLWYSRPPFSSLEAKPDLREAIIQDRLAAPPPAPAPLLTALSLGHQPPPPESLSVPTLLVAGADDPTYCGTLTDFSGRVGARLSIIPNAGHALLREAPADIATVLNDFSRHLTSDTHPRRPALTPE